MLNVPKCFTGRHHINPNGWYLGSVDRRAPLLSGHSDGGQDR
jgi:hypothetical protein